MLVRDSKHNIPLAPCPSPLAPQEYNGILYSDIVAKYWELFNEGKEPVEGDRNVLTFELAVTIRSICGYSLEKMMQVIPNYWKNAQGECSREDVAEWRKTIENALKEPKKGMPYRLKQVLAALKSTAVVKAWWGHADYTTTDAEALASSGEVADEECALVLQGGCGECSVPCAGCPSARGEVPLLGQCGARGNFHECADWSAEYR